MSSNISKIQELLGDNAGLLTHECKTISKDRLHLPGPDFVDRVVADMDRSPAVMRNLELLYRSGRLAGSGYLSILPVDQGIEHAGGASFAPNPDYFDPPTFASSPSPAAATRWPPPTARSGDVRVASTPTRSP